ncbi:MAG: hypothetical protein WBD75_04435 [Phycisphaerae bacterium]
MKNVAALGVLALAMAVAAAWAGVGGESPATPVRSLIDPEKPETWKESLARLDADRAEFSKALIAVAMDEKRHPEAREKAVFLLGKVGDPVALDFLIDNVSRHFWRQRFHIHKSWQCQYALGEGDWRNAQAIFEALAKERPKDDVGRLCSSLNHILPKSVLLPLVEAYLRSDILGHPVAQKNLTTLKSILLESSDSLIRPSPTLRKRVEEVYDELEESGGG